jgi:hypothetical protein
MKYTIINLFKKLFKRGEKECMHEFKFETRSFYDQAAQKNVYHSAWICKYCKARKF